MNEQIPYTGLDDSNFGGFNAAKFGDNPEPRVACVLVLDVSGSMSGRLIEELNAGLSIFKDTLMADRLASLRAEVAIVTFGGSVTLHTPFTTARDFVPPTLEANGLTPMGEAINQAIDLVIQEKRVYQQTGIQYYRPWIFLITDGEPSDDWQAAAARVKQGERKKEFVFFAVGVEDADMEILQAIAAQPPKKLRETNFRDLFLWLSQSMKAVSISNVGDKLTLPASSSWEIS